MKTLRVCLASELPDELDRSPDYLYFAYDKLYLYSGQNYLEDNFAIVDEIPEDQVYGMIYILNTDGSVHRMIDYADTKIAEIEDPEQITILQKAGTMFYINAQHRYIDSQRRVLTLPFNDGTYELNASTKNETVYDENTILKFNPETERFEVYGDSSEEFIDYSKPFRGSTTNTAEIEVKGPRISGKVKLSEAEDNLLKAASDGLYINANGCVSKTEFNEWVSDVFDMKQASEDIIRRVEDQMEGLEEIITPEYISNEIHQALYTKYPEIDTALTNYDEYVNNLDEIENAVLTYAADNISTARNTLFDKVTNYEAVEELDPTYRTFTHEVDYYAKAEEFYYPPYVPPVEPDEPDEPVEPDIPDEPVEPENPVETPDENSEVPETPDQESTEEPEVPEENSEEELNGDTEENTEEL